MLMGQGSRSARASSAASAVSRFIFSFCLALCLNLCGQFSERFSRDGVESVQKFLVGCFGFLLRPLLTTRPFPDCCNAEAHFGEGLAAYPAFLGCIGKREAN